MRTVDDPDALVEFNSIVQVVIDAAVHPRILLVRLLDHSASLSSRFVRTDHAAAIIPLFAGDHLYRGLTHRHPGLVELVDHDFLLPFKLSQLLIILASLLVLSLHTLHKVSLDS